MQCHFCSVGSQLQPTPTDIKPSKYLLALSWSWCISQASASLLPCIHASSHSSARAHRKRGIAHLGESILPLHLQLKLQSSHWRYSLQVIWHWPEIFWSPLSLDLPSRIRLKSTRPQGEAVWSRFFYHKSHQPRPFSFLHPHENLQYCESNLPISMFASEIQDKNL